MHTQNAHTTTTTNHALIIASNPNPDSLTLRAATHAHNTLVDTHIASTLIHLDTWHLDAPSKIVYPQHDNLDIVAPQNEHSKNKQSPLPTFCPLLSKEDILRRATFDPTALHFQHILAQSTVLALYFPDWWGFPPALLVGWLQRIFVPGVAFVYEGAEFMPKHPKPLLSHIKAVIALSSDESDYANTARGGELISSRVFAQAGISHVEYAILPRTHASSFSQRKAWMQDATNKILKACA